MSFKSSSCALGASMICLNCKAPMIPLFTSLVCAAECDRKTIEPKNLFEQNISWVNVYIDKAKNIGLSSHWDNLLRNGRFIGGRDLCDMLVANAPELYMMWFFVPVLRSEMHAALSKRKFTFDSDAELECIFRPTDSIIHDSTMYLAVTKDYHEELS